MSKEVETLSLTEASRRLGHPRHMKLMRFLIRQWDIPVTVDRRGTRIAVADMPKLREALDAWRNRPRVVQSAAS